MRSLPTNVAKKFVGGKRPSMQPIETRFKGYKMRSRLEARWAVFFDRLPTKWLYEPEGFKLGNGLFYLPDFFLPELSTPTWIEVKPCKPMFEADQKKIDAFRKGLRPLHQQVFVLFGNPWPGEYEFDVKDVGWCRCPKCGRTDINIVASRYFCCYCDDYMKSLVSVDKHPELIKTFTAARSARFEYGEDGT